jgi:hypothetical protein
MRERTDSDRRSPVVQLCRLIRVIRGCPKGRCAPVCGKCLPGLLRELILGPRFCTNPGAARRYDGAAASREEGFAVFRCSSRKFTASEALCSAEILACARSGDQENSKTSAVLPLFFPVFGRKNSENRENRIICRDQTSLLSRICASYHANALFVK